MKTKIQISVELRDRLKAFAINGETYEQVISKALDYSKDELFREIAMDERGTISLADAIKKLNVKKSRKS